MSEQQEQQQAFNKIVALLESSKSIEDLKPSILTDFTTFVMKYKEKSEFNEESRLTISVDSRWNVNDEDEEKDRDTGYMVYELYDKNITMRIAINNFTDEKDPDSKIRSLSIDNIAQTSSGIKLATRTISGKSCDLCSQDFISIKRYENHLTSGKHLKNVAKLGQTEECPVCDLKKKMTKEKYVEHCGTSSHIKKANAKAGIKGAKADQNTCPVCKGTYTNEKSHKMTKKHIDAIKEQVRKESE